MRPLNLTGKQFGRLTACTPKTTPQGRKWVCQCSCGRVTEVATNGLVTGRIKSCGCFRAEANRTRRVTHGKSSSRAYRCWKKMRNRCLKESDPAFCNYGGRGITVCEDWLSFEAFYRDMGDPPEGTSLERINNNLGYSKSNVVWASRKEQARNKRNTLKINFEGEDAPVSKVAEITGIHYKTLYARLTTLKKTPEKALDMGLGRQREKERLNDKDADA